MLLNRLVKRDSTQPAYSSDHATLPYLLFINNLDSQLNANHLNLSNVSLKQMKLTDKCCT